MSNSLDDTARAHTAQPSTIERLRDAAVEQQRIQQEEWRRVANLVLRRNPGHRRVAEIVSFCGDYLVQVVDRDQPTTWTTVVHGRANSRHFYGPESAMLHLLARRVNDIDANQSSSAAFYAGRVLGITDEPTD
jgi:hypothetical protein